MAAEDRSTVDDEEAAGPTGADDDAHAAPGGDRHDGGGGGLHESRERSRAATENQYDTLIRITTPSLWIGLGVLLLAGVGVIAWSVFYNIEEAVEADGILLPEGGLSTVAFTADGTLSSYAVEAGDEVQVGDALAVVQAESGETTVTATSAGTVDGLSAVPGSTVEAGESAVVLQPDTTILVVYGYFPLSEGKAVEEGQMVEVTPLGQGSGGLQHFTGSVQSVTELPVSSAEIEALTASQAVAEAFSGSGPVLQVVVALDSDDTTSGFNSSNEHGDDQQFTVGSLATVRVITSRIHPISQVFS